MPTEDDAAYLARRIDEERRRAAAAPQSEVAAVHDGFASRYAERLAMLTPGDERRVAA